MRNVLFTFIFLFMLAGAFAAPTTNVHYFYSVSCSHCQNVEASGIIDKVKTWDNVTVEKYEVSANQTNLDKLNAFMDGFNIPLNKRGYPFLVIEQEGSYSYLFGDGPIIEDLEDSIVNFTAIHFNSNSVEPVEQGQNGSGSFDNLNLWVVLVAALIDSINPCAFGVLLFLMAVLLSLGSSKRAFRAGMIYTFVIFLVYLGAGFGIMRLFSTFDVLNKVKIFVGVLIIVGGLIEIKDFFWDGKGISLRIPKGAKPWLEKYSRKGTLWALIVLGVLVALVELPCTGGIYLAILSLISESGTVGSIYLVIYNVIFVLPLVLITYFITKGASVDSVNSWVQSNKKWMRLAAGVIMILLGLSLFGLI